MRVAAVMVAFNRAELLREALTAVGQQTRPVDELIVVDNASTDESAQVAAEMVARFGGHARLIALTENTGGAGGFATGIAAAVQDPTIDWVWVMDDDTVPEPTALAEALAAHERFIEAGRGRDDLAVMGSRVVWTDGEDHPMNTPKPKIGASQAERDRAAAAGVLEIRSISFVSAFVRAELVRKLGLPIADYFLWNDDFEYSARLLRRARGIQVPGSVVMHKTKIRGSSDQDPGERFYFEVRNKLWLFRTSKALKPWEKLAYTAASARRWARTFKASSNRGVLWNCLGRGLRHGLFTRPRPTADVLAGAGLPLDVSDTVFSLTEGPGRS
ncbi:glycosyltransferase [Leucobacter sp. UCMA 4100]|uniref:glycosyltransferase n=1 Tax=Leucobacter sp. UCMA 4100 TaxID=2810534 RepID=UPI0022EB3820|nr:glycosyltransferase [Leucobacter sp. UCMA 4100]